MVFNLIHCYRGKVANVYRNFLTPTVHPHSAKIDTAGKGNVVSGFYMEKLCSGQKYLKIYNSDLIVKSAGLIYFRIWEQEARTNNIRNKGKRSRGEMVVNSSGIYFRRVYETHIHTHRHTSKKTRLGKMLAGLWEPLLILLGQEGD